MFPVYPWDRSSLKSMPLDLQEFEKLDTYASQVREQPVCIRWLGVSRVRVMKSLLRPLLNASRVPWIDGPECLLTSHGWREEGQVTRPLLRMEDHSIPPNATHGPDAPAPGHTPRRHPIGRPLWPALC